MERTSRITDLESETGSVDQPISKHRKPAQRSRIPKQQKNLMRRWRVTNQAKSSTDKDISIAGSLDPARYKVNDQICGAIGDGFADTHDVIKRVNSPHIRNVASMWYWMDADPTESSYGWLRGMKAFWERLMFQTPECEASYLAIAMYFALRRHGQLTSADTDKHAIRAKVITLQCLQSFTQVSPCLLVIIGNLTLLAMAEGDMETAKTHWKAMASFSDYKVEDHAAWAFVNGLDVRFASNLMVKPALPYHLPQAFKKPLTFSSEELASGVRLGSENALALKEILGAYYLQGRNLLVNIHHLIRISSAKKMKDVAPIFGLIYDTVFNATTLVATFKEEPPTPATHYREILGIAISLAFWSAVPAIIPQEGVIQHNLVRRASVLLRQHRGVFIKKLLNMATIGGALWVIMIISLQAWLCQSEDLALWISLLEEALREPSIKAMNFQSHSMEWPYAPTWVDLIDHDPWTLVKTAETALKDQVQFRPPKQSLVL